MFFCFLNGKLADLVKAIDCFGKQAVTGTTTRRFRADLDNCLAQSGGAFHSTKISGNSGSKSNGTESFRKIVSKISIHLSRLSFFLEI